MFRASATYVTGLALRNLILSGTEEGEHLCKQAFKLRLRKALDWNCWKGRSSTPSTLRLMTVIDALGLE